MNTDKHGFRNNSLTQKIIGIFYEVYNELGHGFLESVYEKSLALVLTNSGLTISQQVSIPVWFRGHRVGDFAADLLVDDIVLLELKAVRTLDPSHEAQLLNYLRATDIELGLLLNFGDKPEIKRMIFDNERKKIRVNPCVSVANLLDGESSE